MTKHPLTSCLITLFLVVVVVSCSPAIAPTAAAVTQDVAPTSSHTSTPTEVPATPTPIDTPTEVPATQTPTTEPTVQPTETATPIPATLVDEPPIFTGGDVQYSGWSPDSRYLLYFEYTEEQVAEAPVRGAYDGMFVIYDTQTGEKCTDYPLSGFFPYEGGSPGNPWQWLPDGTLLIQSPDRPLERMEAPCVTGEPVAVSTISSIETFSPNLEKLLMVSNEQYIIYDWQADTFVAIPEIEPTHFNNLVWSPDGRHISVTLAGNNTGNRDPIGGTRIVDVATGEIIGRYDWEPANALDGTFGGPVWVSNDTFVVTLTLDQGPFFMTLDGEVTPVLPLFGETFERANYWPPLEVYADVEGERYAIVYTNGNSGVSKLYVSTSDEAYIESLEQRSTEYRMFPDGLLGYAADDYESYFMRPVFEEDEPFVKQPTGYQRWPYRSDMTLFVTGDRHSVMLYDVDLDMTIANLQFAGYETGYNLRGDLSPDEQWLVVFASEPKQGLIQAVFIVPVAEY